jgi:hypothetical protein
MGAAGHLAAAAWAHQPQLMLDGLDKPRPSLAGAAVGQAYHFSNDLMTPPNQSRQPTPGERQGCNRTPSVRRGCAYRSANIPQSWSL